MHRAASGIIEIAAWEAKRSHAVFIEREVLCCNWKESEYNWYSAIWMAHS
jgi:hypothetical protein